MRRNNSFLKKFLLCFILGLTVADIILLLGTDTNVNPVIIFGPAILSLSMFWVYPFVWQYREIKRKSNSRKIQRCLEHLLYYLIGFGLSVFGWKKITGLQFNVPMSIADQPMSEQSGEWLTWYYFGYSHIFSFIIGTLQIVGASLLFFRRTRLAGILVLLPIITNIFLINIFYHMNAGALFQSFVLALGLIYLFISGHPGFINAVFPPVASMENQKEKNSIIRIIAILLMCSSFLIIYNRSGNEESQFALRGKYKVKDLTVNNEPVVLNSSNNDTILKYVYFDLNHALILKYKAENYQQLASYQFDANNNTLKAVFKSGANKDSLSATISRKDAGTLYFSGVLGNDELTMELVKIR